MTLVLDNAEVVAAADMPAVIGALAHAMEVD
ncbi:MAG: hypothetical protein QOH14_456, partial [Pseudonocardiales bacterium]|nr:hypothetical protein [Pseudonocardiales bacterium]